MAENNKNKCLEEIEQPLSTPFGELTQAILTVINHRKAIFRLALIPLVYSLIVAAIPLVDILFQEDQRMHQGVDTILHYKNLASLSTSHLFNFVILLKEILLGEPTYLSLLRLEQNWYFLIIELSLFSIFSVSLVRYFLLKEGGAKFSIRISPWFLLHLLVKIRVILIGVLTLFAAVLSSLFFLGLFFTYNWSSLNHTAKDAFKVYGSLGYPEYFGGSVIDYLKDIDVFAYVLGSGDMFTKYEPIIPVAFFLIPILFVLFLRLIPYEMTFTSVALGLGTKVKRVRAIFDIYSLYVFTYIVLFAFVLVVGYGVAYTIFGLCILLTPLINAIVISAFGQGIEYSIVISVQVFVFYAITFLVTIYLFSLSSVVSCRFYHHRVTMGRYVDPLQPKQVESTSDSDRDIGSDGFDGDASYDSEGGG